MNTYVALLRGINVGGKSLVTMAQLKILFENAGFVNVSTYINSGNVIFQSNERQDKLETFIEAFLADSLPFVPKVVVRSYEAIDQTVKNIPISWESDISQKCNVIFLKPSIDSADILKRFSPKPNIETIAYYPGVLYWSALTGDLTKSTMIKLSNDPIYQDMTVRGLNTTRKLESLMRAQTLS